MQNDPLKMVDVSRKEKVFRSATAIGTLKLRESTMNLIKEGGVKKGDPLIVAEVAAIYAVKKTPDLIPLCHNIPIGSVDVKFQIGRNWVRTSCRVTSVYMTGVEMEALMGVSIALLNIWDMVKYLEKDDDGQYPEAIITDVKVIEKRKE